MSIRKVVKKMVANYENKFYKDYEKLQSKNDKLQIENKHLILQARIAEDNEARMKKVVEKKQSKINDLKLEVKDLKEENKVVKYGKILEED